MKLYRSRRSRKRRRDPDEDEAIAEALAEPTNLMHAAKKALGFKVTSRYSPPYRPPWKGHWYFSSEEKYPANMEREGVLPDGRRVRLVRSAGRGSTHRIQIKCAHCDNWIPVGRMHQHRGTKKCLVHGRRPMSHRGVEEMAERAFTRPELRPVLHDALIEAYGREYQRIIDQAEFESDMVKEKFVILFNPLATSRAKRWGSFTLTQLATVISEHDIMDVAPENQREDTVALLRRSRAKMKAKHAVQVYVSGSRRTSGDRSRRRSKKLTRKRSRVSRFVKKRR